jgi:hypothetical protein
MGIFIVLILTIGLVGASQSDHKEEESAKIVTEKAIERCYTQGHEKKCELRYK